MLPLMLVRVVLLLGMATLSACPHCWVALRISFTVCERCSCCRAQLVTNAVLGGRCCARRDFESHQHTTYRMPPRSASELRSTRSPQVATTSDLMVADSAAIVSARIRSHERALVGCSRLATLSVNLSRGTIGRAISITVTSGKADMWTNSEM